MAITKTEFTYGPSITNPINGFFRDSRYSPAVGSSLWAEAATLAAQCDPGTMWIDWDDFIQFNPTSTEVWTTTLNSGTIASTAGVNGGAITITTSAGVTQMQKLAAATVAANKPVIGECLLSNTVNAACEFVVGLVNTDTDVSAASAPTEGIYFRKDTGDANIDAVCVAASTSTGTDTDTTIDIVDATNIRLGWIAESTRVRFFINGILRTTYTANISTAALRPTLMAKGTAKVLIVDYFCGLGIR